MKGEKYLFMRNLIISLAIIASFASAATASEVKITALDFYPSGAKFTFNVELENNSTFEAILPGAFKADTVRLLNPEDVHGNIRVETRSRTKWIPDSLAELNSRVEAQSRTLDELNARKAALEQTLTLLKDSSPETARPEKLLEFIRDAQDLRLDTENELAALKITLEQEKATLTALRNELNSRSPSNEKNYLVISGQAKNTVKFEAFTSSATWRPNYILNLDSSTGNIDVQMFIKASQKTGLDYNGNMTLHTKTPDERIITPELKPLKVAIKPKQENIGGVGNVRFSRSNAQFKSTNMQMEMDMAAPMMMEDSEIEPENIPAPAVQETFSDRIINIQGLITGDGKESEFDVIRNALTLKSEPVIMLIPEQRSNAWIIAEMSEDNEHLIPGNAELRVDNTTTGKIFIEEFGKGQKSIPFGYIDQITVKKEALITKQGVSWFSGVSTNGYKLEITNGTKEDKKVLIRDRLPVPTDEKIKLDIKRIEPQQKEKDNENRFKWELEIPAGETANIIVDYTLSYPSGEELRYGTK